MNKLYLGISEDSIEIFLTEQHYSNCLGSSRCQICHKPMETQLGQPSCLTTIYFHSSITALTVCDSENNTAYARKGNEA